MKGYERAGAETFIRRHTELLAPRLVPEIRLHLASEVSNLWMRTEEELGAIGLPPPFWAFAWAGGQALARYILDHPESVGGRNVTDFACGSGIVGIAAALAGAQCVVGFDTDVMCAAAVPMNALANRVHIGFCHRDPVGTPAPSPILLAGDAFYDKAQSARLANWFAALSQRGVRILVGDPGRAYLPRDRMEQVAEYRVETTLDLEDAEVKQTKVWRFA